ncbi:TetR/AcrR family transcriptional regulator [Nocardioides sp. zg-ZUI104]|uniref:TetR/AcrR family transcriptional regulator n=1 Tax=Nocardioides faecalis TaxID=2803858 RepID=UPI001BD1284B|nr:TetR/AcrR family transcriptional regulator [Nocardioides faecalis]MBS4754530.1 TetR/AcrR family transcriptional regulator [Nocardioides faecalis]
MPRIDAPTVAEHHARQRRVLLDAARVLLAETGQAPSMAALGRRAGLARSSVYQYFSSPDDLLRAVVADVFPDWARQVQEQVASAGSPAERVWAYVEANVSLFASSEQAVAHALTRVVEPAVLQGPMEQFHAELQVPLRAALTELGEPEVGAMAELVDSLIVQASRNAGSCETAGDGQPSHEVVLARLRRLLGGYLGLDGAPPAWAGDAS